MIKIIKEEAPENLVSRGTIATNLDFQKFNAEKEKYFSGELKFEANNSIYNSDVVREALEEIQNNKCCYCETKSTRSNIDVEHFRPKTAFSSDYKGVSKYPGYFWLAYDWNNLFLACQVCNQIFKNDFFPIEVENTRAQTNNCDIKDEVPLFIHPSIDEPEIEIKYRESVPFGITEKGKKTIAYLGFGSVEHGKRLGIDYSEKHKRRIIRLADEREKYYREKELIFDTIKIFENMVKSEETDNLLIALKKSIEDAVKADAVWSSMIKCAVDNNFKFY